MTTLLTDYNFLLTTFAPALLAFIVGRVTKKTKVEVKEVTAKTLFSSKESIRKTALDEISAKMEEMLMDSSIDHKTFAEELVEIRAFWIKASERIKT